MTPDEPLKTLDFVATRSPYFRVVRANGIWGGPTPAGDLSIIVYSERVAFPTKVTYPFTEEGTLENVPTTDEVVHIHREIEVEAILNSSEARKLYEWLGVKLEEMQALYDAATPISQEVEQ